MAEHEIGDHRDAARVRGVDEFLDIGRRAVRALDRVGERAVVAPRHIGRELADRHELDRVDAEILQVVELGLGQVERRRRDAVRGLAERAEMHLVDHELIPTRHRVVGGGPGVARRVDHDRVADRVGDLPRARVVLPDRAGGAGDHELVLRARIDEVDVARPVAVAFAHERIGGRAPVVEGAGDAHRGRVRSPHAEGRSRGQRREVRNRAHARARGLRPRHRRREERKSRQSDGGETLDRGRQPVVHAGVPEDWSESTPHQANRRMEMPFPCRRFLRTASANGGAVAQPSQSTRRALPAMVGGPTGAPLASSCVPGIQA